MLPSLRGRTACVLVACRAPGPCEHVPGHRQLLPALPALTSDAILAALAPRPYAPTRTHAQVPCAMDIKLPHDLQSNICHEATPALPAYVHISMIGQKGDNVNCQDPLRGPTVVRLTRNNLEGQQGFCPVVAMFEFVQLGMLDVMAANNQKPASEQVFVPLFPAYDADLDSFHYYQPMLASDMKNLLQMVLDKCKWLPEDDVSPGERITPHGIRSSATVAALRGGHDVAIVMQGGGWNPKSFGSVLTYANQNRIYAEDFKRLGKPDPMFRFWTYAASFVKVQTGYRRRKPFPGSLFKTNRTDL